MSSVSLNPKNNSSNAKPEPEKPKKNFFEAWADFAQEGNLMAVMSCKRYCVKKLSEEGIENPDPTSKAFERCIEDCEFVKWINEASRKN